MAEVTVREMQGADGTRTCDSQITFDAIAMVDAQRLLDRVAVPPMMHRRRGCRSDSPGVPSLRPAGLYKKPFGIAFSDFHLHPLYDKGSFYLANIEEQKQKMVKQGIAAAKIFVTGFSLKPLPFIDAQVIRNKFRISNNQKIILLGSGSLGLGINIGLLRKLSEHSDWHTIVVCGNDREVFSELNAQFKSSNISILGFYQPMDELYSIADIFFN